MARGTKRDGFAIDKIVNTKATANEIADAKEKKQPVKTPDKPATQTTATAKTAAAASKTPEKNAQKSKPENLTTLIKEKKEQRQPKMIYLYPEQKRLLDKYARQIGKANGGASRIVGDALMAYFDQHPLN